jgi:DNA-binding GntR family transcriptional regulator
VLNSSHTPRPRTGSDFGLARRIEQHILFRGLAVGEHLSAQLLADLFGASRTPVNQAMRILASRSLLEHKPQRGFFVGEGAGQTLVEVPDDILERAYHAVAHDRLAGDLPQEVRETSLRARYGLTKAQLHLLLGRIMQEGWIERRVGYGWMFTEILTTGEALEETFRLRRVLEPASLLEPGYRLEQATIDECRRTELALLQGAFTTMPADVLFDYRARFHEIVVGGSRNRFFLDTIRRVNRIRRLLSYEAMSDRSRYVGQAEEHLAVLDLLEAHKYTDAAHALRTHLERVQANYSKLLRDRSDAKG